MGVDIESQGKDRLVKGYIDYGLEVIKNRAIPDVRDGLKPVQRRIIYSACKEDRKFMNACARVSNTFNSSCLGEKSPLSKCVTFVSNAMKLHPHGDAAIWGTFCLMTDENGSFNLPFFTGMGNLGKVYSSAPLAKMRYPKAQILKSNSEYLLRESDVMKLVVSEEGDGEEPEVLPACVPVLLINGSTGIAVSTSTNIAPFNFNDVLNLAIKYNRGEELGIDDMIFPDFPTGGILIADREECAKIMLTGKGRLKIRAKVDIQGKQIKVVEVPYGKTTQSIVNAIDNADIDGIQSANILTGRDSDCHVKIICKTKKQVESVLMELYRKSILQTTFNANFLVINDGIPEMLGVYDIIKEWSEYRVGVLEKKFNSVLSRISNEKVQYDYFIRLIDNQTYKDTFVNYYTKEGEARANQYLHEIFEDIPSETAKWICDMKLKAFHRGDTYRNKYEALCELQECYSGYLANPQGYIVNELTQILSERTGDFPRKTELTTSDYKFSKIKEIEIEDDSSCVFTLKTNGFLLKTRDAYNNIPKEEIMCMFPARANSVLVGFDNYGRVLRVLGKEIPFSSDGVFLPKYFGVDVSTIDLQVPYRVLYMGLLDGKKRMLTYRDGYVSFLDTSEFIGKRATKVISKGVPVYVMDKLLDVYEEEDIPEAFVFLDIYKDKQRVGVIKIENINEPSRKARTKVITGKNVDIRYSTGVSLEELQVNFPTYFAYLDRLVVLEEDVDISVSEGKYTAFCVDI